MGPLAPYGLLNLRAGTPPPPPPPPGGGTAGIWFLGFPALLNLGSAATPAGPRLPRLILASVASEPPRYDPSLTTVEDA